MILVGLTQRSAAVSRDANKVTTLLLYLHPGHKQLNDKQYSHQQAPSDPTHCGACQPVRLPDWERWLQDQGNSRGMLKKY